MVISGVDTFQPFARSLTKLRQCHSECAFVNNCKCSFSRIHSLNRHISLHPLIFGTIRPHSSHEDCEHRPPRSLENSSDDEIPMTFRLFDLRSVVSTRPSIERAALSQSCLSLHSLKQQFVFLSRVHCYQGHIHEES
jgi:hypothetical protein